MDRRALPSRFVVGLPLCRLTDPDGFGAPCDACHTPAACRAECVRRGLEGLRELEDEKREPEGPATAETVKREPVRFRWGA